MIPTRSQAKAVRPFSVFVCKRKNYKSIWWPWRTDVAHLLLYPFHAMMTTRARCYDYDNDDSFLLWLWSTFVILCDCVVSISVMVNSWHISVVAMVALWHWWHKPLCADDFIATVTRCCCFDFCETHASCPVSGSCGDTNACQHVNDNGDTHTRYDFGDNCDMHPRCNDGDNGDTHTTMVTMVTHTRYDFGDTCQPWCCCLSLAPIQSKHFLHRIASNNRQQCLIPRISSETWNCVWLWPHLLNLSASFDPPSMCSFHARLKSGQQSCRLS